jgi:hypothetical protein
MNPRLLVKTLSLIVVALLLVLMGMNNKSDVTLTLPPLITKVITLPAAIMYFGFFGLGLFSGVVLFAGGGKKGGGGKSKGD